MNNPTTLKEGFNQINFDLFGPLKQNQISYSFEQCLPSLDVEIAKRKKSMATRSNLIYGL